MTTFHIQSLNESPFPPSPLQKSEPPISVRKMKMEMKFSNLFLIIPFLLLQSSIVLCSAQDFDFFYFVLQWPGSYCDTSRGCCYPSTGKPAEDFGIHGLWPNYRDGSYPSNCDPGNPFDQNKISDLIGSMRENWPTLACPSGNGVQFWTHEWEKHGTCSESVLDQHDYFQTALNLKKQLNLVQVLAGAGIEANGGSYSLGSVKNAIEKGIGYTPFIECNVDEGGNSQLYQIYLCVDSSASSLIQCPIFPTGSCPSQLLFPSF